MQPSSKRVLLEVEKRKHCKNPFDDRFLQLALSSFQPSHSMENTERAMEESIYNASVNVSLRTEIIKEMLKQTANEVEKFVIQTLDNRTGSSSDGSCTITTSPESLPKYDRSRFLAFSCQNQESIKEFSEVQATDEFTSKNTCLKELPCFIPSYSNQYYVLNDQDYYNREDTPPQPYIMDMECLDTIFAGFESVLSMSEDKIEHLFRQEGIETTIYEDVSSPEESVAKPLAGDVQDNDDLLYSHSWDNDAVMNEENVPLVVDGVDNKQQTDAMEIQKEFSYKRVLDMDALFELPRVKGKDTKLR